MTSSVITVIAVVAGIIWLGLMLVAALRNKGGAEEIAPNLQPGIDDQELETRRLETGQKAAIAFSAFLAISLPLYFLGENQRQEGFVEEFHEASVERGLHEAEEFGCFSCHGPEGVGGVATFVEKRSGVTVSWAAPALNDIFYRYDHDEVAFWITWGRPNTPMPAWGVAGGGPMNEKQVEDLVTYLETIQIPQQEAVDKTVAEVSGAITRLDRADATVEEAIINQSQVVAEIDQAPEDVAAVGPLIEEADELMENPDEGIDTDGDGLADAVETRLSELTAEIRDYFVEVDGLSLDPETSDAEALDTALDELNAAVERDPIFLTVIASIEDIVENDEITDENPDTDGDGLSDQAESDINGRLAGAADLTVPSEVVVIDLDPADPQSSGDDDLATATRTVGGLDTVGINLNVAVDNVDRLRPQATQGLDFLIAAQGDKEWEIDIAGVAAAMGVSEEDAERAVGLFNAHCARCHTAGYTAGVPYTLEAGSGGFGPALWDGRPLVQFGAPPAPDSEDPDLLIDFLTNGSEAQKAYGINGIGSGRMPAFGAILSEADIELLAAYLRAGNMDGME